MTSPSLVADRRRTWWQQPDVRLFLLTLVLASIVLCYELGRNPIQLWDESRTAVNAAEMDHTGNWLVTQFKGEPDTWNTKPPLLIWLQTLCLRLFGYSEWSIRLPSTLAALGTVTLLYWFAARTLKLPLAGLLGSLVLVTSTGFVRIHVARTGDYDALLVFWLTLATVSCYRYLEYQQPRALYWLAVAITAAVFTKSVAGLIGLPAFVLYALLRGRLGWLLSQPRVYFVALGSIGCVAAYVLMREQAAPGYWEAVLFNDLGGRFFGLQPSNPNLANGMEGLKGPWDVYLTSLATSLFLPWVLAVPPAWLTILYFGSRLVRRAGGLLGLFAIWWLLLISVSATKTSWYDAPIYPMLALLVGLGMALLLEKVHATARARLRPSSDKVALGQIAVIIALFFLPYKLVIDQIIRERHNYPELVPDARIGSYLRQMRKDEPQQRQFIVLYEGGYNAVLDWYRYAYEQQNVNLQTLPIAACHDLMPESVVVTCNPEHRVRLDSLFQTVVLHENAVGQTLLLLPHPH